MSKKITVAIVIIVAIIALIYISKSKPENKEENEEQIQQKKEEVTPETLDESIKSTMEILGPKCVSFLAGELSGDPNADCPGFEIPLNKDLCYYCFATKNKNSELCIKISDPGLKAVCKKATGSSLDDIINK